MNHLYIYTSNRLERLADQLGAMAAEPVDNPLAPEIVVVHSKEMAHWVSMELARRNGVCANFNFHFPNAFLNELFRLAGLDTAPGEVFETDVMTFHLMKILPDFFHQAQFGEIKNYLADDTAGIKLFRLCRKVAHTFDQYLTFRPEMIFSWENGKENHWQAALWRRIAGGREEKHRAGLRRALFKRLPEMRLQESAPFSHVSVFGMSYLPPFHLEVLSALSQFVRVNLFALNPCREYWGRIVSSREIKRIKSRYDGNEIGETDLFLEKGNPLLGAFGEMGRDFFDQISGLEGLETASFEEPVENTILGLVQSDILNMRDRTEESEDIGNSKDNDGYKNGFINIRVHSCHGPLREMEILHDQMLSMFENDPGLTPRDILVMAPDIESYAPFIQAVFDGQTDAAMKIPFSISDRRMSSNNPVADALLALFDTAGSRFSVRNVMQFLDFSGIRESFGIMETDLVRIEAWIDRTNIRWGIDSDHRRELGLPQFAENTWRAGLDRLILGYAMPGEWQEMFEQVLPYDDMEGEDSRLLGKFLNFFQHLMEARGKLLEPKTLLQWSANLKGLMDLFFASEFDWDREKQALLKAFSRLSAAFDIAGYEKTTDGAVVKDFLTQYLAGQNKGGGFISRGVTFCSMLPLRSIPAKVICLIGLNDDAFPRIHTAPGFDLMAEKPKPGDRIRRNDDKYLFLQAIVAAGDALYISYMGQSPQDNSEMPPSVVVNDLLDYLVNGFGLSATDIVVKHRLHAFSKEYFDNAGSLFSYSREDFEACLAARNRQPGNPIRRMFIDKELPFPKDEPLDFDLDSIFRFYSHPSGYFLKRRLGVFLEEPFREQSDAEEFNITGLNRYTIENDLLSKEGRKWDASQGYAMENAMGRLPHGSAGKAAYSDLYADVVEFRRRVNRYTGHCEPDSQPIRISVGGYIITGAIEEVYASGLVQAVCAKIRARHVLKAWIAHLAYCLFQPDKPTETVLVGKDVIWTMDRPDDPAALFRFLVNRCHAGMAAPLVFFPETALAYAENILLKNGSEDTAMKAARSVWTGNEFVRGESDDPYYQLCFPPHCFESVVLSGDFAETAIKIYQPIFTSCWKIKQ